MPMTLFKMSGLKHIHLGVGGAWMDRERQAGMELNGDLLRVSGQFSFEISTQVGSPRVQTTRRPHSLVHAGIVWHAKEVHGRGVYEQTHLQTPLQKDTLARSPRLHKAASCIRLVRRIRHRYLTQERVGSEERKR